MAYADFSGREIVRALRSMGIGQSHEKAVTSNYATSIHEPRRYHSTASLAPILLTSFVENGTDEVRIVSVPLTDADDISQDTYRSIAAQCGANDFDRWISWIERHS